MAHPNSVQIRRNRFWLWASRASLVSGAGLLVLDYYLTFLTPFWDFRLLLWMFIIGCALVVLAFGGKFLRMWRREPVGRSGDCVGCGACCKQPVRCIFLHKNRCLVHRKRPRQCRSFPAHPGELVSEECGYWFG